MTDYVSQPGLTALGSITHNYIVHKMGILGTVRNLLGVGVTDLGLLAFSLPIIGKFLGYSFPSWARDILAGTFAESFNVPGIEQMQRTGTNMPTGPGQGPYAPGFGGLPSAYAAGAGIPSPQAYFQSGTDASYITPWGYT